jgi:hypothetical protein
MCEWGLNLLVFGIYSQVVGSQSFFGDLNTKHIMFLYFRILMCCATFLLPMILCVVILHYVFRAWIYACCKLIIFWYKYDEPIMVFLCYFAWCVDSSRCKHQYCSAWQCSRFFLFNYMFYDIPLDLSSGIKDSRTFWFPSLQQNANVGCIP